jgi:DNA modification methylase
VFDGHASRATIRIGNCLEVLAEQRQQGIRYDAIVTDPPYEIGLHGKEWDQTGIAFSPGLWALLHDVLKPGGYIAAFAAARHYHKLAAAAEAAGMLLHPMLIWRHGGGLPKPVNLSEMFDRQNVPERRVIGYVDGSGFTKGNDQHGAQRRFRTEFAVHERHVSEEDRLWAGYYYGVNAMRSDGEPILLAQRPIEPGLRAIENVRRHGTGALNIGALRLLMGSWPSTVLDYPKARGGDRDRRHPSVKPVGLVKALCLLTCPQGGRILDPFAGTGTTGVAAIRAGLEYALIEADPAFETVIHQRLGRALAERETAIPNLLVPVDPRLHVCPPKRLRRRPRVTPPEVVEARARQHRKEARGYRERLPERGIRAVQVWAWDMRRPEIVAEAQRQAEAVASVNVRRRDGEQGDG